MSSNLFHACYDMNTTQQATLLESRDVTDVPADVADDLAERVRKDAESFAETFSPEKTGEERRPAGPSEEPTV